MNQTWICLPAAQQSQSNMTPGCGKGKYSIYCSVSSKGNGQLLLKRPELLEVFQEKVFKNKVREGGCGARDQFVDFLLIGGW